jgi:hypothetical protein
MDVIIYLPDCEKLCNALAIIEVSGYMPTVIEYYKIGLGPGHNCWAALQRQA